MEMNESTSPIRGESAPPSCDPGIERSGFLKKSMRAAMGFATIPLLVRAWESAARADVQFTQPVIDSLNFLLRFEYLTQGFYEQAENTPGLIPELDRNAFSLIRKHEDGHVNTLKGLLGGAAIAEPPLDFTGGGQFQPFNDFAGFLLLSQGFEDLAVRAYKGQLPAFLGFPDTMTIILEIQSTEARHAAHVRQLRGLSAWVAGTTPDAPQLDPVYAGEDNVVQGGSVATAEAFDEPLSTAEVQAFLAPFFP